MQASKKRVRLLLFPPSKIYTGIEYPYHFSLPLCNFIDLAYIGGLIYTLFYVIFYINNQASTLPSKTLYFSG